MTVKEREGEQEGERERERVGNQCLIMDKSLCFDTITVTQQWEKRTIHHPGNGPHTTAQDCTNTLTEPPPTEQHKCPFCIFPSFSSNQIMRCTNNQNTHHTYFCCDLEVLVLLQQLLCVMNAGTGGCVCGQVKLPSVMYPLQGLGKHIKTNDNLHTARF